MADDFNLVVLAGVVTHDPEITYEESGGTPFTTLSLEIRRSITNADGSLGESVLHVDVTVLQSQAELCTQFLRAGSRVLVSGVLDLRRWTDNDGTPQSTLRVRTRRIQFLDRQAEPAADAPAEPL